MQEPPIPENEAERLELIYQLNILDTQSEEIYDGITYIASLVCQTPISSVTIVDRDRQWFKSVVGGTEKETPRAYSFCAHAILHEEAMEIPDSNMDERFKDNPYVAGAPFVRFYAGYPLELKDGLRVGTLCVVDHKPKHLSEEQHKVLHYLSLLVTKLLELRLHVKEVEIRRENDANVVNMLTHELRNPLVALSGFFSMTKENREKYHDTNYDRIIEKCEKNADHMLGIVNQFLNYAHWKEEFWILQKSQGDVNACITESAGLVKGYAERCKVRLEFELDENIPEFDFDYNSIISVVQNLISNAAKYSPEGSKIILSSRLEGDFVKVSVQDFGVGIPKSHQDKLFKPFALVNQENKAGIKGSGLGLAIVKKIVEKHGGSIKFESAENKGTQFFFKLPIKNVK